MDCPGAQTPPPELELLLPCDEVEADVAPPSGPLLEEQPPAQTVAAKASAAFLPDSHRIGPPLLANDADQDVRSVSGRQAPAN